MMSQRLCMLHPRVWAKDNFLSPRSIGLGSHCVRQQCLHRENSTSTRGTANDLSSQHATESSKDLRVDSQALSNGSDLPPHSLLSTKMLLRSFLVSTVSSHPWLLRPALSFLLLVTKKPFWALDIEKNPVLNAILKKTFYEHFCAGETLQEVKSTVKSIKDTGFKGVILTYAREIVVDERTEQDRGLGAQATDGKGVSADMENKQDFADIDTWQSGVLETLEMASEGDFLALKLTGAGPKVAKALRESKPLPPPMQTALDKICETARSRNVGILVDAEQQSLQSNVDVVALQLMQKYNQGDSGALVYNTYQMYLKKLMGTLNEHLRLAAEGGYTLGVKMVRGAYIGSEPRHLIHNTKEDTDRAYDGSLKALLECKYVDIKQINSELAETGPNTAETPPSPPVSLFVATHNKLSAMSAVDRHRERLRLGLPTVKEIQYGQLMGMADEVSCKLLQLNGQTENIKNKSNLESTPPRLNVYKCLSWGTLEDCLSYLLRRAIENRDAVGRTKTEEVATRAELWRRMKASVGFSG